MNTLSTIDFAHLCPLLNQTKFILHYSPHTNTLKSFTCPSSDFDWSLMGIRNGSTSDGYPEDQNAQKDIKFQLKINSI